ncbi:MAG: NiFe-hydrogenase large subunit, partial [Actinomycetota bacterium]|nr:NiFe-hydrogenase large subunit [Actinomycetota bacterium]
MTVQIDTLPVGSGPTVVPGPPSGPRETKPYRKQIKDAIDEGYRFAGLHVGADGTTICAVLVTPEHRWRAVRSPVSNGEVPTIVDLVPAAGWDEREAHDLYGVGFTGHSPLRPLVHRGATAEWTVPVRGPDSYQIAVGPIHAGVIESGHFRFHVVGDEILHLDAQLFHKHRGLERAAEGSDPDGGMRYVGRACAACSVSNDLAYAHAWEEALGLTAGQDLARSRTVLLELERVWSHLNDIAAACAGVGLAVGNNRFAALTERARRLNGRLGGHRFLARTVCVGRSELEVDAAAVNEARAELVDLRVQALRGWRELLFNASFQDRMVSCGVLTRQEALDLGTVGPAARACGILTDARAGCDRLLHQDFRIALAESGSG